MVKNKFSKWIFHWSDVEWTPATENRHFVRRPSKSTVKLLSELNKEENEANENLKKKRKLLHFVTTTMSIDAVFTASSGLIWWCRQRFIIMNSFWVIIFQQLRHWLWHCEHCHHPRRRKSERKWFCKLNYVLIVTNQLPSKNFSFVFPSFLMVFVVISPQTSRIH